MKIGEEYEWTGVNPITIRILEVDDDSIISAYVLESEDRGYIKGSIARNLSRADNEWKIINSPYDQFMQLIDKKYKL